MNRNYAQKVLLLVALGWVALPTIGCPAGTQQSAAKASLQVTVVMQSAQQGEIAAHNNHLIPDNEHQFIQKQFITLAEADKAANACISAAPNKGAVIACLDTAVATVDGINREGGTFLKSPAAQANFTLALTSVKSILQTIEATLGAPINGGQ